MGGVSNTAEPRRRLDVLKDEMPNLFLRSGNRCAWDGCHDPILNGDGLLVGEVAHIEGVSPEGPRYRVGMTNHELRRADNLVLLCHEHHLTIDRRPKEWSVDRVRELKLNHEAIYTSAIDRLAQIILDVTEGTYFVEARNLARIVLHEGNDADELLAGDLQVVHETSTRLADVPLPARSLLALILFRGAPTQLGSGEITVKAEVIRAHAGLSKDELTEQVEVLEHHRLAWFDEDFDGSWHIVAGNSTGSVGWPLFRDIKEASNGNLAFVRAVIVELNFAVLDR